MVLKILKWYRKIGFANTMLLLIVISYYFLSPWVLALEVPLMIAIWLLNKRKDPILRYLQICLLCKSFSKREGAKN
jgi:hypothetical protein